jgi:MFS family permease
MTNPTPTTLATPTAGTPIRRVVAASLVGTALETYDLYLYGTAAALIFAPLFFPASDPTASLLLSLSSFAVSFIARPIGAIVFGHYGDRIGRRAILMTSLIIMGLATFGIGLLPTYSAIGVVAPVALVLLRFLQGFGFGGEYSAAVLIIAEHAPPAKRGFYAGLNNIGPSIGFILSTSVFLLCLTVFSPEAFLAWGWRIPFLLSVVLVGVGIYLRLRIEESPVFAQTVAAGERRRVPVVALFRYYPKQVILGMGALISMSALFYFFSVYSLSYGTTVVGYDRNAMLGVLMLVIAISGALIPVFARLSDRIGRRNLSIAGVGLAVLWMYPMMWLIDTGSLVLLTVALVVLMTFFSMFYGPMAAFLGELFGTSVRSTGVGIVFNFSAILGAAITPLILTALVASAGASWPVPLYLTGVGILSLVCVLALRETKDVDLREDRAAP